MNPKFVLTLVTKKNMSASDMTHLLSEAGCGNMQNGIKSLATMFGIGGTLIGTGITVTIFAAIEAKKFINESRFILRKNKTQESLSDSQIDNLGSSKHFPQDQPPTPQTDKPAPDTDETNAKRGPNTRRQKAYCFLDCF